MWLSVRRFITSLALVEQFTSTWMDHRFSELVLLYIATVATVANVLAWQWIGLSTEQGLTYPPTQYRLSGSSVGYDLKSNDLKLFFLHCDFDLKSFYNTRFWFWFQINFPVILMILIAKKIKITMCQICQHFVFMFMLMLFTCYNNEWYAVCRAPPPQAGGKGR